MMIFIKDANFIKMIIHRGSSRTKTIDENNN